MVKESPTAGESYEMMKQRYAKQRGHIIEYDDGAPVCRKCNKGGWFYLEEKCLGAAA